MTPRDGPDCRFAAALVLSASVACLSSPALAQDAAPPDPRAVKPERPTVATHAYTVAPGIVELESGIQFQHPDAASSQFGFAGLFKIGLADGLQFDVTPGWSRVGTGGTTQSGISDLVVGLKWHVADSLPVLNNLGLQSTVKFPTGSADRGTGTGTTDVSFLVISSRTLGVVALDINAGYTRRNGDGTAAPKNAALWTLSFGFPVKGPLNWVAEVFGNPGTSGPGGSPAVVAFLSGPTFTVNDGLVIDAGGIFNVTGFGGTALYTGVTWNVGRVWTPRPVPPKQRAPHPARPSDAG